MGDVRMGLAEDSLKVERIVAGSYGAFEALYAPLLLGGGGDGAPLLAPAGGGGSGHSSPRREGGAGAGAARAAVEDARAAHREQHRAEAEAVEAQRRWDAEAAAEAGTGRGEGAVAAAVVADAHLPPPSTFAQWLLLRSGAERRGGAGGGGGGGGGGGPLSSPESLARLRARSEAAAAAVERARAARLAAAEAARRFRLRLAELRAAALRRRRAGEEGELVWRQDAGREARAALLRQLPEALLRAIAGHCGLRLGAGEEAWRRALLERRRAAAAGGGGTLCAAAGEAAGRWAAEADDERPPPLTDVERAAVARAALRAADYSAKRGAEKALLARAGAPSPSASSSLPGAAADEANAAWPLRPHGLGRVVAGGLFALVGASSRRQALAGLLTTGPSRSAVYLGAKLRKAWRTRVHNRGAGGLGLSAGDELPSSASSGR